MATSRDRRRPFALLTILGVAMILVAGLWLARRLRAPGSEPVNLDLTVVQTDDAALPFFELLFDYSPLGDDWNFADPHLRRRGKPLLEEDRAKHLGPHDLLGFRNRSIPTHPDLVVIGDSQTYGMNALIDENWPSRLAAATGLEVYNMSMAGWSGLSYLYMTPKALAFRPRLLVVAPYMGNDSVENVMMAYGGTYWQDYRPRPELTMDQIPLTIRARQHEQVRLSPRRTLPFQTAYRFDVNNPESIAVSMGYDIQIRSTREMIGLCRDAGIPIAIVILPTKEFVYATYLRNRGIGLSDEYYRLLAAEEAYADQLKEAVTRSGGILLDVGEALRARIDRGEDLYPASGDGHPSSRGYRALADEIGAALESAMPRLFR